MTITALFVDDRGPYYRLNRRVDAWNAGRDARLYNGPHPVVAHPPCKRWGRYWSGGPSAKIRRRLGDDGGCFAAALYSVRTFGGVLEHPEASHAFRWFGLARPVWGEWTQCDTHTKEGSAWVTSVDQGTYGHLARKRTWLYCVRLRAHGPPPPLNWQPAKGARLDHGYHSAAERARAVKTGTHMKIKRLTPQENLITPDRFADVLIKIAEECGCL